MSERLFDRHQERKQAGARRYLESKRMLRDFVGPGGVKLSRAEQLQLWRDAQTDPDLMVGILQNRQTQSKIPPDQVPIDFCEWDIRMQAMQSTESGAKAQALGQSPEQPLEGEA